MKFEIRNTNHSYLVELESDGGGTVRSRVLQEDQPDLEQTIRVLSQNQGRWTFEIGGLIEDVLVSRRGDLTLVEWRNRTWEFSVLDQRRRLQAASRASEPDGVAILKAQMPGKVISVLRKTGDAVENGQGLVVIESMKMQNELISPKAGVVRKCSLSPGQSVVAGELLYEIE